MPTLTDLRNIVADYLGQPISETGRLTTARVDRAIEHGYLRLATDARRFTRTATITSVANQAAYTLPMDVLAPVRVTYGGDALLPTTYDLLEIEAPGWQEAAAGTPSYWMLSGAMEMTLSPAPSASGVAIAVFMEVVPSTVTGGIALLTEPTSTPGVPYQYQRIPALYAVWDLAAHVLMGDAEAQASGQAALAEYEVLVKEYIAAGVTEGAYR